MGNNYFWNWILNKTLTIIAYALSPITYPIHLYQMRKLDKKLEDERRELERIKERNKLRT
tara:strand:- start:113 stop:292 length:180 start_codon:yes stop_codon:yes gene_type:complete